MKITRVYRNLNNTVSVEEYPEDFALNESAGIKEIKTSHHVGNHFANTYRIYIDGVNIAFFDKYLGEDWVYDVRTDFPYLQMHFELSGNVLYTPKFSYGMHCPILYGEHSLFYYPALHGRLVYPAGQNIFSAEIEISLAWLHKVFNNDLSPLGHFANEIGKERPAMLGGKSFPVTARIRSILMEMYHCHFVGSLKKIFIEGKLLELLSLQVEQMTFKKSGNSTVLKKDDIERIHYVKELLLQNLSNPHSIQDLASLAGMNRTKLQHSFKEVFGNTIYGYLADERMNKAMGLLKEDNYVKIAEIARQIGYKNPNHFSVAFKKKFGYLPKDVKNTAEAFS